MIIFLVGIRYRVLDFIFLKEMDTLHLMGNFKVIFTFYFPHIWNINSQECWLEFILDLKKKSPLLDKYPSHFTVTLNAIFCIIFWLQTFMEFPMKQICLIIAKYINKTLFFIEQLNYRGLKRELHLNCLKLIMKWNLIGEWETSLQSKSKFKRYITIYSFSSPFIITRMIRQWMIIGIACHFPLFTDSVQN